MKKIPAITYVWITTLLLFTVTIMVAINLSFNWVFYGTAIGQVLLVFMVFAVLKDNYTTDKSFDDFYEDYNPQTKKFR